MRKKDFSPHRVPKPNQPTGDLTSVQSATRVHFPVNTTGKRSHDFGPFYGRGIDVIVHAIKDQVDRLLRGEDKCLAMSTIVGVCNSLPYFFRHLVLTAESEGRSLGLNDVSSLTIRGFLAELHRSGMRINAQKKRYDFVKIVLVQLAQRGKILLDNGFPQNPFPRSNQHIRGATPYTSSQRRSLAKSLRTATQCIFDDEHSEITGEQLSWCFLAVALRTGVNLTPLLELRVDAIRPHVKPGMKLLLLTKRRGNRRAAVTLPAEPTQEAGAVLPSTARLLDQVLKKTAGLRDSVTGDLPSAVWLYRSRAQRNHGEIIPLTLAVVRAAAARLATTYHLVEQDGKPLAINVPRMRKTFVNRVYELSGENVLVAANAAGHSPRVSATHYLVPDKAAEKNWKFMGEALVGDLMGETGGKFHATPSGKCRDNRGGEYAPKDGSLCINFLDCFRCRSYVVTADDLYKVFSLYWMVVRERKRLPKSQWKRVYANVVRTIDEDIVASGVRRGIFDEARVMAERTRAEHTPHPFWRRT